MICHERTLAGFHTFLFWLRYTALFLHTSGLLPEISWRLVRNPTHFFQHVIPLETMFKGQSPGQLSGRYTLHDCEEIDPFSFWDSSHSWYVQAIDVSLRLVRSYNLFVIYFKSDLQRGCCGFCNKEKSKLICTLLEKDFVVLCCCQCNK